jgi:hypothetical protein
MLDRALHNGLWSFEYLSKHGELITKINFRNGITDMGVAHVYDGAFHAGAQITTWYIGLIDNSGYVALAAADTMASHAGWNEFTTYSDATRIEWTEAATAARTITSSVASSFAISGSGTVKGAFLVSVSTKSSSDLTDILWSTGVFSNPPTVANGETLKVTYSLTG